MFTSRTPPAQQQQSGDLLEHFQLSKMNNLWSPKKKRSTKKAGQVQVSGDFYQNFNFILLSACIAAASTNKANIPSQNKGTYKARWKTKKRRKWAEIFSYAPKKLPFSD